MKDIAGYEGLYAVDMSGVVCSLQHTSSRRLGPLKPYVNTSGYHRVNLYDTAGKVKKYYVHRLVALTYIPNPVGLPDVNHKNANKADNSVDNLEWCDAKHNIAESRRLGLQRDREVHAMSIITGESKSFSNIREAATDIAGKHWAFRYPLNREGNSFYYKEWRIEVMPS